MLKYTLCFLKKGTQILMLNRSRPPLMGKWNGVGGKLEPGETAEQGVLREVLEETGIRITHAEFTGTVTWKSDEESSGMYVFIAELSSELEYDTPVKADEGILDWKELDWVLNPVNEGVADNIGQFLPVMLAGERWEHRFLYDSGDQLIEYGLHSLTVPELAEVRT